MIDFEKYKEHIEYTFHAFCRVVIRNAAISAAKKKYRKQQKEISLEYLMEEKYYQFGIEDEYCKHQSNMKNIRLLFAATRLFSIMNCL